MVISLNGFRGKITLQHLFSNTPTPTPNNYGSLPLADPISRYRVLNFKFTDHGFFFFFFFWLTEKSSGHRSVSIMNRLASIIHNGRNGTGARCMRRFKAWTGGFHWLLDFGSFDLEICDGCECFSREIPTKLERKKLMNGKALHHSQILTTRAECLRNRIDLPDKNSFRS